MSLKAYATAKEIALAMAITERAVQIKAKRESWQDQPRQGRGGGREYAVASLPPETRHALATQNTTCGYDCPAADAYAEKVQISAEEQGRQRLAARAESLTAFRRLPAWQRKSADAKLAIIRACNHYITRHALARTAGQDSFCYEYNAGNIDVVPWVRCEIRQIHPGTLRTWIREEHDLGAMGLVDLYGNRKGQSKIETNPTLKAAIDSLLDSKPHIKSCHINEFIQAHCPSEPMISTKSIDRYRSQRQKNDPQRTLLATNPDKFKSSMQPAFGSRSEGIFNLNQLWEFDATPADVMLIDGRHSVLGMIDVYSRRMKLLVSKTSRTVMVNTLMRRGLLDFGVPDCILTDNGQDYTSDHFERVLSDLDIDHDLCDPFSGDQKPHIERGLGTFSHDLVELLPGYIGHSVADRKDIESRKTFAQRLRDPDNVIEVKMTAADFHAFCDNWCAAYHQRVHSSLGKKPATMANEWAGQIRTITDERALDVLLASAPRHGGMRAATKNGIKVDRLWYVEPALVSWIGKGRVLQVLYEPEDLGRIIVQGPNEFGVYEHVCVAVCPEVLGISRLELARATNEAWKQHTASLRDDLKRSKNVLKNAPAADIIMAARLKDSGRVVPLTRSTVEYTTPGLTAAAEARAALDGTTKPITPPLTAEEQAMKARIRSEFQTRETTNVRNLGVESARSKYKRMSGLRNVLTDGGSITEEEYRTLMIYEQSNEYRVFKGMELEQDPKGLRNL
jgi:hypothetical protein